MNNILITSAGRRVSLVRAFKKELTSRFKDGKVFTTDMMPELSAACHVSDGAFKVPHASDPHYCESLLSICLANDIKLVIPTIDTELIALSQNIDLFKNEKIKLIISSHDMVLLCRDKRKTHWFFDKIGLDRPREIDTVTPEFPLFAKPYDGSSSIGAKLIRDIHILNETLRNEKKMIFIEYLNPNEHTEYTVDMYFDRNHFLKCAVPRQRIEVRSGEVSKGVTRKDDLYKMLCSMFAFCEGFIGCITLQVFRHNDTGKVIGIEINPRFGGGYPLSYHANANYPDMIIKEYLLNDKLDFNDSWVKDLLMLRYDDEIIQHDYKS
jgi:carbamoyl-phosphate synthase large subunit